MKTVMFDPPLLCLEVKLRDSIKGPAKVPFPTYNPPLPFVDTIVRDPLPYNTNVTQVLPFSI